MKTIILILLATMSLATAGDMMVRVVGSSKGKKTIKVWVLSKEHPIRVKIDIEREYREFPANTRTSFTVKVNRTYTVTMYEQGKKIKFLSDKKKSGL